jgi:hypothetical protein
MKGKGKNKENEYSGNQCVNERFSPRCHRLYSLFTLLKYYPLPAGFSHHRSGIDQAIG